MCVCVLNRKKHFQNLNFSARLEIMSPGDKSSSDGSNNSQANNQRGNVITTTFVTSDMDCSCSEFDEQGKFYFSCRI